MYRFNIFHFCFIVCACQNSPIINQQKWCSTIPRLSASILTGDFFSIYLFWPLCLGATSSHCTTLYCTANNLTAKNTTMFSVLICYVLLRHFCQYRRSPHFVIFGPKSNHEMRWSWILRTVFSVKPQSGSKKILKSTFWAFFSKIWPKFFENQCWRYLSNESNLFLKKLRFA